MVKDLDRAHDKILELPSAQPELIERTAYIRGFKQGRTQGMIDAQGGKNMIKAEWTNADTLNLQPTCNQLATDCISREAAINTVFNMCCKWNTNDPSDLKNLLMVAFQDLPSAEPERKMDEWCTDCKEYDQEKHCCPRFNWVIRETVKEIQQSWTPCSEELPKDTDPVNITWVNHKPEPYYASIKDKPFTATGCYCDGKWYWYSVTCQDYLDEYRYCDVDSMDENIEVIAWKSLPLPYQGEEK